MNFLRQILLILGVCFISIGINEPTLMGLMLCAIGGGLLGAYVGISRT